MKQLILITLITLLSCTSKTSEMNTVDTTVTKLLVATDQNNWQEVTGIFADTVVLDYSSMNGNPATELTPTQIITAWKGILPGFKATHHQIGNFISEVHDNNTAKVFCYGTATHYLPDEQGDVWTVVGSYNFDLKNVDHQWKITSMKFNFKYQDGNTSLPEKAIKNATK